MNRHDSRRIALPDAISDETAAVLVAFLHELADHAESAYFGQLRRYYDPSSHGSDAERQADFWADVDDEAPF